MATIRRPTTTDPSRATTAPIEPNARHPPPPNITRVIGMDGRSSTDASSTGVSSMGVSSTGESSTGESPPATPWSMNVGTSGHVPVASRWSRTSRRFSPTIGWHPAARHASACAGEPIVHDRTDTTPASRRRRAHGQQSVHCQVERLGGSS
jgi:hypothetical protein